MMTNSNEGSSGIVDGLFSADDAHDDVFLDLDSFWRVMGEPPNEESLEDLPCTNISKGTEATGSGVLSPSYNSEASDCRTGCLEGAESDRNPVSPGGQMGRKARLCFAQNSCSGSVTNSLLLRHNGLSCTSSDESLRFPHVSNEEDLFGCFGVDNHSNNLYRNNSMEKTDLRSSAMKMEGFSVMDGDGAYQEMSHTGSRSYNVARGGILDFFPENGAPFPFSTNESYFFPHSSEFKSLASDDTMTPHIMDEKKNFSEDFCGMVQGNLDVDEVMQHSANCGNSSNFYLNSQVADLGNRLLQNDLKVTPSSTLSNAFSNEQDHIKFWKKIESVKSKGLVCTTSEVIDSSMGRDYIGPLQGPPGTGNEALPSALGINLSNIKDEKEDTLFASERNLLSLGMIGGSPTQSSIVAHDRNSSAEHNFLKVKNEVRQLKGYCHSKSYQGVQNNTFEHIDIDDDPDVCILEDISAPARQNTTVVNATSVTKMQFSALGGPIGQTVMGHARPRQNDERVIYRVALQDLSQPKSEANAPEGLLAVPLLKHQRIALSWLVNKETKSACCSGGILADDQGLGKTISTIALILKERSPSSTALKTVEQPIKAEMLTLDEDEDGASGIYHVKEGAVPHQVSNCPVIGGNTCLQANGRPAAGTLIVCPTSVLRQWSEELHNKVTSEANLSILVYHGSNRTKNPDELAKYDVVVTTYAIVSMEVPKQPIADENDDMVGTPFQGLSSCKKRKLIEANSDKKVSNSKKSKKGIDNELLEAISGPLAKVRWFRVVLDEAQSIKNHRTQVARACWGLRAKRRWCLSGTPIQNSIDDLYSYFRFLRHEPYAGFKTFCEQLKVPIQRNPLEGYKKLQAVLKTIMLRRTKGTVIDGEPIINLPPKTIELKRVDFSQEERDFYCRLEADSRAQFAKYAAEGTVKHNYVNILLMLLRLRQACDHPLLVKDPNSNSKLMSSIKMAKNLPREKQMLLLNCLEASLAICGICNDPPEDAVVTICGHVFCNQCICERMMGDDTQCPTKSCKTHLNMSHVFSITTLRAALSDQRHMENVLNNSEAKLAGASEQRSLSCPQDSSKIRAALELLFSLSKPQTCDSRVSSSQPIDGGYDPVKLGVCESGEEYRRTMEANIDSKNSMKVSGEKAIVFSQWTGMLDLLEACLKNSAIQYRRLDGTMPVTARDRAVKDFNSRPEVTVMIMSLKAASLGLNMVAACHVILLDLWWNPTTEDQAIDRAHRIGQTRPVSVFRLTVRDTVEDRILALQQRKREMVASAFGEDKAGGRQTRLTVEDLKYLFRVH